MEPGIILTKDGELIAAYAYRGQDLETASENELQATRQRFNTALRRLDAGWVVHFDTVRLPLIGYNKSDFDNPVLELLERERERQAYQEHANYETLNVITFVYTPASITKEKSLKWLYTTEGESDSANNTSLAQDVMERFKSTLDDMEAALGSSFYLTRLKTQTLDAAIYDRLLQWLNLCVIGRNHRLRLPSVPIYLDSLLSVEVVNSEYPVINNEHTAVIAIDGFPMEAYPEILAELSLLPIPLRWSNRYILLNQGEAIDALKRRRRYWKQSTRPIKDNLFETTGGGVDLDSANMTEDSELAMSEINTALVKSGFYASVIILRNTDLTRLRNSIQVVENTVRNLGFHTRLETINAIEAFLGTLPGNNAFNVREQQLSTLNLADLVPTSSAWLGERYAPCPYYPPNSPPLLRTKTSGNSPFFLNLHNGDVGHTLIAMPTGYGKSTLQANVAASFMRYKNAQVMGLDNKRSLLPITLAAGGLHYDLGSEGGINLAPFENLSDSTRIRWAINFVELCVQLQEITLTPTLSREITDAVSRLATHSKRSFTSLVMHAQSEEIRQALHYYTNDGASGGLLDAETNEIGVSSWLTFETEELLKLNAKTTNPVMLAIFDILEQRFDGRPTLFFISEAWLALRHPLMIDQLRAYYKKLRDRNVAIVIDTQQISDIMNSPISDVVLENSATKILGPNPNARASYSRSFYQAVGLDEHHIDLIVSAQPKQDYFYLSEQGRRLFQLNLGDAALAFTGHTGRENIDRILACIDEHGSAWPEHWLKQIGKPELASELRELSG